MRVCRVSPSRCPPWLQSQFAAYDGLRRAARPAERKVPEIKRRAKRSENKKEGVAHLDELFEILTASKLMSPLAGKGTVGNESARLGMQPISAHSDAVPLVVDVARAAAVAAALTVLARRRVDRLRCRVNMREDRTPGLAVRE